MRTLDPLLLLAFPISLVAQMAPCGLSIVKAGGSDVENRFFEAPPKNVRAAVLRALPAIGAKLHKEKDLEIEAKTDPYLAAIMVRANQDKGQGGFFGGRGPSGPIASG